MRAIAAYALLKCESLPAGGEGDASLMGMGCYILQNAPSQIRRKIAAARISPSPGEERFRAAPSSGKAAVIFLCYLAGPYMWRRLYA